MDLKKFIKDNRISQVELSTLFDCKPGHVSNIVNGKRSITQLQIRLLIEKYGVDKVMPYADQGEMPQGAIVNVTAPVITDNTAPVQAGNNNSMEVPNDTAALVALMNKMLDQHEKQLQKRDAQIDRLIDILEKK